MQYILYCVCLLSLDVMYLAVACSFSFYVVFNCMDIAQFIHSNVKGHLVDSRFWFLWVVMPWTFLYMFLQKIWLCICSEQGVLYGVHFFVCVCLNIVFVRSITLLFIISSSLILLTVQCRSTAFWYVCFLAGFLVVAYLSELGWICLEWCLTQRMTVHGLLILCLFTIIPK